MLLVIWSHTVCFEQYKINWSSDFDSLQNVSSNQTFSYYSIVTTDLHEKVLPSDIAIGFLTFFKLQVLSQIKIVVKNCKEFWAWLSRKISSTVAKLFLFKNPWYYSEEKFSLIFMFL